jgi:hypothetical protein
LGDSDVDAVAGVCQAVLLIGGDKTGDDRFYEKFVPEAELIYARYLREE